MGKKASQTIGIDVKIWWKVRSDEKMWELVKDLLLVSLGMGIGVVLMCMLSVGKEADYKMKQLRESEDK